MSQKSAAFMSPQAAIARGRENSKGAGKNPMKLIYNFDAHKKTASESMFSNPSSEIPDEMWRAATPMQRQADAVVLWAELTGKHAGMDRASMASARPLSSAPPEFQARAAAIKKMMPGATYSRNRKTGVVYKLASGCGSHGPAKPKKKTVKKASFEKQARNEQFINTLHAIRNSPEMAGALVGAPVGAGKAYLDYRSGKSGISKAEASLMGKLEEARALKADKKKIDKLKKRLKTAKSRRENLGRTIATGAGVGGIAGAGMMHRAARKRGLRGK